MKTNLLSGALLATVLGSTMSVAATTQYYVAEDAKSHACMVVQQKPDGKTAMDVGTKAYDSQANAEKAMANLKACGAASAMAPAAKPMFYVAEDAKTKKCSVVNAKPDGKSMMDVGTKEYDSQANAEKAMANLKVCKS